MRDLFVMAWRNLGRNRRRTGLSLAAVAFAVGVLVFAKAMQVGSYAQMIEGMVTVNTGHLQVQYPGYFDDGDINLSVDDPGAVFTEAERLPDVAAAVARVTTGMLVAHGDRSFGVLAIGTDAAREAKVTRISKVMREGNYLDADDSDGVIIGDKLARNLGAEIGDELVLIGLAADGTTAAAKTHVRGIFGAGVPDMDRQTLMANLEAMRSWTVMEGRATQVAILLSDHRAIESTRAALTEALRAKGMKDVVLSWDELLPGLEQAIQLDKGSGQIMYGILLLVVAFGILNTFLMSAMERTREFGVLLAVGVKPATCGFLIFLESQLLFLMGFFAGLALGGAVTGYFAHVGIKFEGGEAVMEQWGIAGAVYPQMTAGVGVDVFVMVAVIVAAVALYPAWRVTRLLPVNAMRYV
ncbi:MAG: FtsX-like permease family protein [Deltaproteobacteria bacterium]|nr:FtsX-like permease family protein [Deltaproteobacteria bacterium]